MGLQKGHVMSKVSQSVEPEIALPVVTREPSLRRRRKGVTYLWILLFLLPFLVLYGGFTLWPLLATIYYSFFDWSGSTSLNNFIGLGNYQEILRDPLFWLSFRNT